MQAVVELQEPVGAGGEAREAPARFRAQVSGGTAMNEFWALLTRIAGRPSILWRALWLTFCLVVLCYAGLETFRKIVPYVLAGIPDRRAASRLPTTGAHARSEIFANWILPALSWSGSIFLILYLTA